MYHASKNSTGQADGPFVRRALIVIGLAALALIAWQLRTVILLLFGAVVVATIVRAIARPFTTYLRIPERVAVLVAVLLLVGLLGGVGWLLGRQITAQTSALAATLPSALQRITRAAASSSPALAGGSPRRAPVSPIS